MPIDYQKTTADRHITVWIGPSGGTTLGVTDVAEPLADELNNTGGTSGVQPASQSISWNDYDFGMQASEVTNEPSLADASTYEEFGQNNFGGGISFYYPEEYDDNSNLHSIIYDLTDIPGELNDIAVRIDGATLVTEPAADADFVSVYRVQGEAEANPFTPGESKRRTVTFIQKSEFSHFVVVGEHTITALAPASFAAGDKGRMRASQQGRDTTNYLTITTSDADVINVFPGGFYEVVAAGSATVTFTDPGTGDTAEVAVTAA